MMLLSERSREVLRRALLIAVFLEHPQHFESLRNQLTAEEFSVVINISVLLIVQIG